MTVVKSTAITNLDASPPVRATSGQGGEGYLCNIGSGAVSFPDASTTGDKYLMVRVPSNAVVKHLWFGQDASNTTFAIDVGIYYSDLAGDNTGSESGDGGTAYAAAFVASNYDAHTQAAPVDLWNKKTTGGSVTAAMRNQPLWQAASSGATQDPGGFFDIVIVPHAAVSGTVVAYLDCEYVAL